MTIFYRYLLACLLSISAICAQFYFNILVSSVLWFCYLLWDLLWIVTLKFDLPLLATTILRIDDLCFVYKLINAFVNCHELLWYINFKKSRCNLKHHDIFYTAFHNTNYGKYAPLDRTPKLLNSSDFENFGCIFLTTFYI